MFDFLLKIKREIKHRTDNNRSGLYLYILFPITFSFLLTFISARIFTYILPNAYIPWSSNFYVHHFAYGFFIIALSGYLALVHSRPQARYIIAWLYGFGLGLALDEYSLWLKSTNLPWDDPARWSYDGLLIFAGIFILILTAKPGAKLIKNLWPFD